MTYKENITAILECYFSGFKKEIIDSACDRILEQEPYKVSEYDKDHIWYRGVQYISLRRFLEIKSEEKDEPCGDTISRQDVLELAKKGVLISNGNYESVCKAINELPSVNPQPSGDAISRKITTAFLNGLISDETERKKALQYINELPPVNPQPKTGHWITTRTFMHDGEYYCDKCKCDSPNNEKWDYCPNCGAKMVEQQESEEKMTKIYGLPNDKTIIADVDEKHHTATVSVYALDELVEAVNKTGHWIAENSVLRCSECDEGVARYDNYAYCPYCGARMVEPQESEGV